ncbi:dihydrodipicolinate synthase family protein [Erwiniaceae bacterium BAC15a-03b]|uniref:Dihydrodipicolinate synthase family protein n=1 Tax=Winslowiella arboricola TaxID=2978220 RepID=A0A9J6PTH7_9GAMM|nr:dihydrodipicolinate synthase family protein [Winslowiella arboricola]MCU5772443.1 dihydrodipicolinate synthase family protein [Winslowiella arboricola]MCU5779763.1 dihydrodipicolinate synthase family protein [Winslowiella arboricola]
MHNNVPDLIVPPLTPFDAQLRIDETLLQHQVNYVVEQCDATLVIAAGVEAQEYSCLTLEQRKWLIAKTIEFVDGRRPVVAGISHPSFKVALELADYAGAQGAQAVQILAPLRPFGGAPATGDLVNYFTHITRETSLPVMLYLNAGPGADVSLEATIELARLDGIHYIKESSRDLSRVSRLIQQIDKAGLAHYYTTMQMLLITLELGGSGATMPPPAAALGRKLINAWQQGDMALARHLQSQFALFPAQWMKYGLTPVMKAAMQWLGVTAGEPYPPYASLSAQDREVLENYLRTTDLTHQERPHVKY